MSTCWYLIKSILVINCISCVTIHQDAPTISVETVIGTCQLRWIGHIIPMPCNCLFHQVLYGELYNGSCSVGRQYGIPYLNRLLKILRQLGLPQETNIMPPDANTEPVSLSLQERDDILCPACGRWCTLKFGLKSHLWSYQKWLF